MIKRIGYKKMTKFWALQPIKTISQPGETFNISSPNAVINIVSILYFTSVIMLKKFMPDKNITSLMAYAMIFFVILTSLLSDNFMKPPDNPSKGIVDGSNPFDYSRTKSEKDVLIIN